MAKNIVILTMGLDIGGAETHIVELASALKEKGHRVTVFSSGGAYVSVLEQRGIRHIAAPMNNKKPSSLRRSRKLLRAFCKSEHIDVIHSHTRITNYIAYNICKKFHIPFVTTVHFNFKINIFTKLFSHWGTRALSVSEDLRQYVADGYGMPKEKVRITVNGINLNTFSKAQNPELRAQYGLDGHHKVILCVSRIDTGACENVFRFLESAEEIYHSVPDARIIIVGNGNRFEELRQIADGLNAKTTDNFIQLAGAQTNIADYLHAADAFAGVSRSALEAMACRLPTILIGNAGYLGVYSDDIRAACIDTNFTCRGYDYITPHEVAQLMIGMLTHPENFADNVEKAHQLIEEKYSVSAMAEDALASYREAENDLRPYDLMISGYYGCDNFGDEITLQAILQNIGQLYPLGKVIILSHTKENYFGTGNVSVVHRFDLKTILPLMKKTKLFMLGGGSLLQDVTSNRSLFFYLFMLRHAQKYGCKTMIYGNGIGPIVKPHHKKQILSLLHHTDRITLRDIASYRYLIDNGFKESDITLTADEAYNYDVGHASVSEQPLPSYPGGKKILLINLRTYNSSPKDITASIAGAVNRICSEHEIYPVLVPIQYSQDIAPLQKVSDAVTAEHLLISEKVSKERAVALIQSCDFLLTERLHPIVFAAGMKKPFVAIAYDPKVAATAELYGLEEFSLPLDTVTEQTVLAALEEMLRRQDDIRDTLFPISQKLHKSATQNSQIAAELLEGRA